MDLLLAITDGNNMSCRVRAAVPRQLHWNCQMPLAVKDLCMGMRYCPLLCVQVWLG